MCLLVTQPGTVRIVAKNVGGIAERTFTWGAKPQAVTSRPEKETEMATDPVCGMTVDEKTAAATANHQGQTYFFCSTACKATFDKAPAKYTGTRR